MAKSAVSPNAFVAPSVLLCVAKKSVQSVKHLWASLANVANVKRIARRKPARATFVRTAKHVAKLTANVVNVLPKIALKAFARKTFALMAKVADKSVTTVVLVRQTHAKKSLECRVFAKQRSSASRSTKRAAHARHSLTAVAVATETTS